jgi:hypothetical protein
MAVFTSLKIPDLQWLHHRTVYFSSEKLRNKPFTAAISVWGICVTWVGGGDMFLMCFLEGPTSQPTRLAYVPCWRKMCVSRWKEQASMKEMCLLYPDIHMCNRHVSPAPIVEILFSRYRKLLLSCCLDRVVMYSEKVNYCSCFGIFLLKSKQVTREVHFRCTYH